MPSSSCSRGIRWTPTKTRACCGYGCSTRASEYDSAQASDTMTLWAYPYPAHVEAAHTMARPHRNPRETAAAKEAFAAYVALGPDRSLRKLAAKLARHNQYESETQAFNALARWSSAHNWQDRIDHAATIRSEALLTQAAELDADTFIRTSRQLNERVQTQSPIAVEPMLRIRESVRKPPPKGAAAVTVSVSVEIQQIVERIAAEDGLSDAEKLELAAAIRKHLTEART